jgi:hypothetical protein
MSKWQWTRTAEARAAGITPVAEPRKRAKARADRKDAEETGDVRAYVFGRERNICRCCRKRPAESMHEVIPKGTGGKATRRNSIAVCGLIVGEDDRCHTYLQKEEIGVDFGPRGAEETLAFIPNSQKAAECMGITLGEYLESPPMLATEIAHV